MSTSFPRASAIIGRCWPAPSKPASTFSGSSRRVFADRVAVIGAGMIGTATALLATRMPLDRLEIVETDPHRRTLLADLGLNAVAPDDAPPTATSSSIPPGAKWGWLADSRSPATTAP